MAFILYKIYRHKRRTVLQIYMWCNKHTLLTFLKKTFLSTYVNNNFKGLNIIEKHLNDVYLLFQVSKPNLFIIWKKMTFIVHCLSELHCELSINSQDLPWYRNVTDLMVNSRTLLKRQHYILLSPFGILKIIDYFKYLAKMKMSH